MVEAAYPPVSPVPGAEHAAPASIAATSRTARVRRGMAPTGNDLPDVPSSGSPRLSNANAPGPAADDGGR